VKRVVVKLGGSTACQTEMQGWIDALQRAALPLAIVPGGGPFADFVRAVQPSIGFSDRAAHSMAILAMEQFGHVILDRGGRFVPARCAADFDTAFAAGRIPVWLPSTLLLEAPEVPASWAVTSDSLASWLAARLDAHALLLSKQTADVSADDDVDTLAARGIVDASLSAMLPPAVVLHVAHPGDLASAAVRFEGGQLAGRALHPPAARRMAS